MSAPATAAAAGMAPGPEGHVAYLDHAATSPLRPEVAAAVAPWRDERYGNPSGSHRHARLARQALEEARDAVAAELGAEPSEVVFTSGGTEADNLAVLGTLAGRAARGLPPGVVLCSAVEHAAVAEACRLAARGSARTLGVPGCTVREVPVHASGAVDLDALAAMLGPDVVLVSVMLANNEVGTVQPLAEVAELVRRSAPGATLHSDAVQAATYLDVGEAAAGADLVVVSAHKLGGPQGVGALLVRKGVELAPLVVGGGQERELRSGTQNVAGAVGLAAALEAAGRCRAEESVRVAALRDRLAEGLLAEVPGTTESAPRHLTLPGHCHLRFDGVEREELLVLLDEAGVSASGGAACASGALEESHVLAAMGVPPAEARGAVRFTLGHTTTSADVDHALAVVPGAVARLKCSEEGAR